MSETEKSGNAEIQALIRLMDEPDEGNYRLIRSRILAYGTEALPLLEGLLDQHFDEMLQERIMNLVQEIQLKEVYDGLKKWSETESQNLLKGFFLVSRFQYPNLNYKEMHARLDLVIRDIWLEMNDELTALEKVKVINHVLFDIHRFTANRQEMHIPQNFYLNTLLDTRKGSPIALGILYMLVSRSLGIPIFGVNLPQHFILAYAQEGSLEKDILPAPEEILFYINPFNQGTVFTHHEIELYLKQMKFESRPEFFGACSHETIVRRLLTNLVISYEKEGKGDKSEELRRLMFALKGGLSGEQA